MKKCRQMCRTAAWLLTACIMILCMSGCTEQQEDHLKTLSLDEQNESSTQEENAVQTEDTSSDHSSEEICVYVCGAVAVPGVYKLTQGARVYEAILYAGGLTEDAAKYSVNQAQTLSDGEQIYIPTEEEAEQENIRNASESGITSDGKVNINTASKEELTTLNGIGESRADSILAYRDAHGSFQSIEELMNVEGIKEGIFQKIKDSITVNSGS